MLRSLIDLKRHDVGAVDGDFGTVHDFYFDDHEWKVRYLVVDTHKWLPGKKVLLAPEAMVDSDWLNRRISVNLTKQEIEGGPHADLEQPVSRQKEQELAAHYRWTAYWTSPLGSPVFPPPAATTGAASLLDRGSSPGPPEREPEHDPNLRSLDEVTGYDIDALDGSIGELHDLIADTEAWSIRHAVVDTRKWLPGRKVLVPLGWIQGFDWANGKVEVDLRKEQVEGGPEFNASEPVNRDYEKQLFDYYGRPYYWG